ncbi:hypothetical protein ACMFMG_009378 [Clarireedia jacksonii]
MPSFTKFDGTLRSVVSDTARKASFDEIPIISLALPKDQLINEFRDISTRVGFFYIRDHGVPEDLINRVFEVSKEFFHQPRDQKAEVHFNKSKAFRGWEPMAETWVDDKQKPDRKEIFCWGHEESWGSEQKAVNADGKLRTVNNAMAAENVWPSSPPDFQHLILEYYGEVLQLARRLIRIFAVALNLNEDYFDAMAAQPGTLGNIVYYPPQPPTASDIGISPHTDLVALTILCQSAQDGLQVLNPDNEWILAPSIPGTFVVNIGDMLERWSNGLFVSTAHRVINITGKERFSIPVFFGPNFDTIVEPLPTCISEGRPANYKPVQAGQFLFDGLSESNYRKEKKEKGQPVKIVA